MVMKLRMRLGQWKRQIVRILKQADSVNFRCNICGSQASCLRSELSREVSSCHSCGSTVRMRAIVHILSTELFGESMALPDFPQNKALHGVGMSDWDGYAEPLSEKLDYTNTYYHQEPKLDITDISDDAEGSLDFIISSDVYEHVLYPVERAFINTKRLLKENGVFVFTVPYTKEGESTVEHFGELHDFSIYQKNGQYCLKDVDAAGNVREFEDLVFHGGPGSTLEMRVFSEFSLLKEFSNAGFKYVKIYSDECIKYGICWEGVSWSLPIAARK